MMYEQLDIFTFLQTQDKQNEKVSKKLNIGDYIGRIILGEVEKGRIEKIEGNDRYFFYRTDTGIFYADDRTDIEQMEQEAEEIRKQYKTIEIDRFERFFAVQYPPRDCDGRVLCAMAGIFQGMLFWKEDVTYQFLKPEKNLEKAYQDKIYKITHEWWGDRNEMEYTILAEPIRTNRLYWSRHGFYADAAYVVMNG